MLSDKSGLSFGRCYKEENSELPVSCYSVTDSAVSLPLSVSQSLTISRVHYVGIGTRVNAHKGHSTVVVVVNLVTWYNNAAFHPGFRGAVPATMFGPPN